MTKRKVAPPKTSACSGEPEPIHPDGCMCDPCAARRARNRPSAFFGYARVSTSEQETRQQVDALEAAGCPRHLIFVDEGVSGAKTSRPALDKCLAALQSGDTLVVWRLDRLGRSTSHLLDTIDQLKARGVEFLSIKDAIDSSTATGRAMLGMLAVMAQFERELTIERINAALAAKRRRGERLGGRHFTLTADQIAAAEKMLEDGQPPKAVSMLFKVDRTTLWRAIRRSRAEAAA